MMNKKSTLLLSLLSAIAPVAGWAQTQASSPSTLTDRVTELEHQVESLTREVKQLKLGPISISSHYGSSGEELSEDQPHDRDWLNHISIGGFGEAVYTHFSRTQQNGAAAGQSDMADLNRAVLEVEYRYNNWITLDTELEFEHATTGEGTEARGEAAMEEAFLDFNLAEPFHVQTGLFYVPMGLHNQENEPIDFHGVFRPNTETFILPTDWSELGGGFTGRVGIVSYESDVVTGLQAVKNPSAVGFSGASGLREGRTEGSRSLAESLAWVSRLDFHPSSELTLGGSFYTGEADQDLTPRVPITLWDAHAKGEWHGAELRMLYTEGLIGGAGSLNSVQAANGAAGFTQAAGNYVGRRLFGGYVEPAFNVLSLVPGCKQSLAIFSRYERYDTQSRVPNGFNNNPANSHVEYTLGVNYKPIPQIVAKGDYQWLRNQALTGINQLNFGIGYTF